MSEAIRDCGSARTPTILQGGSAECGAVQRAAVKAGVRKENEKVLQCRASQVGPESCACVGNDTGEALAGGCADWVLSFEMLWKSGVDPLGPWGRHGVPWLGRAPQSTSSDPRHMS